MRTLLVNVGPVAHMDWGSPEMPLTGAEMSSTDELVSEPGSAILIENGIISKISSTDELISDYAPDFRQSTSTKPTKVDIDSDTQVFDISGLSIVPGFVDAHTHLLWAGDRSQELRWRLNGHSYKDIANMGGGIGYTVSETRKSTTSDLYKLGLARLTSALSHGTTAMEVKSGYGLSTESELMLLECAHKLSLDEKSPSLDLTWLGAHAAPPGAGDANTRRKKYVEEILSEQIHAVTEQGHAHSADVFCEPGWFTLEETEQICSAAKENGLAIRLHVDEFEDGGGAGLAAKLGAVTADHAHYSNDEGREACAQAGTFQGFLLGTPYVMGENHWPPISQCIDEGWPWTIATDYNPNCQILSMPFIGSIASQQLGIDPLTTLVAATRNPALTVNHRRGLRHGVIAEGAAASLNVLRSEHWESWCQTPGQNPHHSTMMDGKWVSGAFLNNGE